ncbi:MAG: FtsX-like permease family protein [Nitratireductor sp.]
MMLAAALVAAVAAAATPGVVVLGLHNGVVATMSEELSRHPWSRQLRPIGHGAYDAAFFDALAAREDVGYVLPATRFLAASAEFIGPDGAADILTLTPTTVGDPLLDAGASPPASVLETILSRTAAEALDVEPGAVVSAVIERNVGDENYSRAILSLTVLDVLPIEAEAERTALVAPALVYAIEAYRESERPSVFLEATAPAPLTASAETAWRVPNRPFSSFRLYATTIFDVGSLRDHLAELGVRAATELSTIALVERVDRALRWTAGLILAGVGGSLLLILGALSWLNTQRKLRHISVLSLIGVAHGALALFPVVQAVAIATAGWAVATVATWAAAPAIDAQVGRMLSGVDRALTLSPGLLAATGLGVVLLSALASFVAARRILAVQPGEGLHE